MAVDTQSLMTQGKCYVCVGASQFQTLKLALLAQITNAMATDVNILMDQAKCYICLGISIPDALELALLSQIVAGGGGGGNAQLVTYTSGTPANPTNTANPAIAYDPTGNLPTLGWNVDTQSWN